MFTRWLSHIWAAWFGTPARPRPQTRARLALHSLEGRAVPSAATTAVFVDESPDMVFDFMTFRRDKPADDRWAVDLERRDGPDCVAQQSAESVAGAACVALMFGTAAVAPYDREEDAVWDDRFHGVRVAG